MPATDGPLVVDAGDGGYAPAEVRPYRRGTRAGRRIRHRDGGPRPLARRLTKAGVRRWARPIP